MDNANRGRGLPGDSGGRTDHEQTTFQTLLTLLEAYQRLGGDNSDDDVGPAAADHQLPDNGVGDGEEGPRDLEEEEENSNGHHDDDDGDEGGPSGQEAEHGEVQNSGDDDPAFTMGAFETHNYDDAIIVGSSGDYSSSGLFVLPSDEEFFRAYTSTRYHDVGGAGASSSTTLHHGDQDELPPVDADSGNDEAQHSQPAAEQHADEMHHERLEWEAARRLLEISGRTGRLLPAGRTTVRLDAQSLLQGSAEFVAAYRAGQRPASAAAVAALEKRKHGGGEEEASPSSAAGKCVICFEDYEVGDDMSVMPCSDGHSFHQLCLAKWLAYSRLCPLRRTELIDDDENQH